MNSWRKPVLCLIAFAFCALASEQEITTYSNYQVVEVGGIQLFQNEDEFFSTLDLPLDQDLEVLHEDSSKGTLQVLVNPSLRTEFRNKLADHDLTHEVMIEDVGQLIDSTNNLRSEAQILDGEVTYDRYMTFQEIENFLKENGKRFSSKVKVTTIGQSYEGENITMVAISNSISKNKRKSKPIIFVEAGAHPREWISIAAALYLIDMLSKYTYLTREVEWRIVPVLNPDGYKYTWTKSRLWRKNRRQEENTYCKGVDLNRNFDSYWNKVGTSSRRCSSIYAGKYAFSEPETRALRDAVSSVKQRVKAYVSFHSYGQLLMYPPGGSFHTLSKSSSTWLDKVATKMSDAILRATNTAYKVGSPKALLYSASGISMDWAMLTEKIPLAFTFEMRDKGKNGFLLPNSEIPSAVNDIWSAMKVLYGAVVDPSNKIFFLGKRPLLKTSLFSKESVNTSTDTEDELESSLHQTNVDDSLTTHSNNIVFDTQYVMKAENVDNPRFGEIQTSTEGFLKDLDSLAEHDLNAHDTTMFPEEYPENNLDNSDLNNSSNIYQTDDPFSIDFLNQENKDSVADSVNNSSNIYQTDDPFSVDILNQEIKDSKADIAFNFTGISEKHISVNSMPNNSLTFTYLEDSESLTTDLPMVAEFIENPTFVEKSSSNDEYTEVFSVYEDDNDVHNEQLNRDVITTTTGIDVTENYISVQDSSTAENEYTTDNEVNAKEENMKLEVSTPSS